MQADNVDRRLLDAAQIHLLERAVPQFRGLIEELGAKGRAIDVVVRDETAPGDLAYAFTRNFSELDLRVTRPQLHSRIGERQTPNTKHAVVLLDTYVTGTLTGAKVEGLRA